MIVYSAIHSETGKRYVGITTCATITKRRSSHKAAAASGVSSAFYRAIRAHGWDAFAWEILERCDSLQALLAAERRWIAELKTHVRDGCGYNLTFGGEPMPGESPLRGRKQPLQARMRRSATLKGRMPSAACRAAGREAMRRPDVRQRISRGKRGKSQTVTEAVLAAARRAGRARTLSEHGAKMKRVYLDDVRQRRDQGESFAKIGKQYGVNAATVFYYLKREARAA